VIVRRGMAGVSRGVCWLRGGSGAVSLCCLGRGDDCFSGRFVAGVAGNFLRTLRAFVLCRWVG